MISWKVRFNMKYDLTLAKIKNTNFDLLYNRFIVGENLSEKQYESLLASAICFTYANDINVQQLGYRIIVEYCNQTGDYIPLYEIAINKGLYPVSKFIELHYVDDEKRNFFTEWNDAFVEQYALGDIYQSEQQHLLVDFFNKKQTDTISVIAPTSYGKSELILSAVKEYAGRKICILTSTKALLTQTKKRIQPISKQFFSKIIVHPEMYNSKDQSCLAVLTQERLLRLFKKDSRLAFDCIIVDEAHEILEETSRSHTLANVIIVAQKRNPSIAFKFLTPFLYDSENLKTRYTMYDIEGFKVNEYIKSEKYYLYDLRNHDGLQLYDQFYNRFLQTSNKENLNFEEDVVKAYSADKNIVYLNKPTDIENFALALADVLPEVTSDAISAACRNISNYLQPQYNLLACLRKGIIYHHGSVPDAIRFYIEKLYKEDSTIKYVISNSTLLSGVNLPAERMFILDSKRGRGNLTYDAFKNLVGRVCRFSEIFNKRNGSLQRLEPKIFLVFGKYFAQNINCKDFLQKVAKIQHSYKDNVKNVLLSQTEITEKNKEELQIASEFIENYENGIIDNYKDRYTKTNIGKACVMNGVSEIDIFSHEEDMQRKIASYSEIEFIINNTSDLMRVIKEVFIPYLSDKNEESLKRLERKEAQNFYAMLLNWRASNKSYAEMISLFVGYWRHLLIQDKNAIIFVGRWGDIKLPNGNIPYYTKLRDKTKTKIVNLAIVRIKEEQDYIDNKLLKYVEVLNDLGFLESSFYAKIKYGTDDEEAICLIKNGLSLSSAVLLLKKYRDFFTINVSESTVAYKEVLISKMKSEQENDILIYEVQNCI